jgi:hypothetical protein
MRNKVSNVFESPLQYANETKGKKLLEHEKAIRKLIKFIHVNLNS